MPENVDWKPLGNASIRKTCLFYPMGWTSTTNIESGLISVSKYGGLIAVIHGDVQTTKRPDIVVYNAAGNELSSFRWNSGTLVGISWTHADDLLCIQEDGQVLLYDVFCHYQKTFTMGKDCRDNKVVEFQVFTSQHGTGVAVMNGVYRFLLVNNIDEPKVRILADVPGLRSTPPSCWCVLPGSQSSRILAANDKDLFLLDSGDQCHHQHPSGLNSNFQSYIAISVSLDEKNVVLFTNTGMMWIGSSDFQNQYCEFNTGDGRRPNQLLWCSDLIYPRSPKSTVLGNVAVVVYRPGTILLIGPKKDWAKYDVDEVSAYLSMDVDGVHLVTSSEHSFIQFVPKSVENIFKVGSMEPGALLYDAKDEYNHGSEKADEYLRMLVEEQKLETAVKQCMDAASNESEPHTQKRLLQATSFGKSFLQNAKLTKMFADTCKTLRVLNIIRSSKIGYYLTTTQLRHLTDEVLIDRLVHRRFFQLAFEISKYLKFSYDQGASRILSHWACYKVQQTNLPDNQVASAIWNKLKTAVGVSYASIADQAVTCGRKELAVKLLDFEPRASEQVRMLSKLGKHQLALEKAVLSGDTDLIYSAISSLRERSGLSDFLVAIRQQPVAYKLHLKFCREQNERMLKDLHEQEDDFIDLAYCHIRESMGTFRPDERSFSMHAALDCFKKARDEFQAKATEDQISLLREQSELEQELDGSFVEIPLHDTLHKLLLEKRLKKAEQLRKQFKVSDKRWWWLRVAALAQSRSFAELENFGKSKKSPIGYLPFIEECLRHSAADEAAKYLSKVAPEQRVAALLMIGNISKAAELAMQTRDLAGLDKVLKKCGPDQRDLAENVRSAILQLQRR